jgi:hypothetical protein
MRLRWADLLSTISTHERVPFIQHGGAKQQSLLINWMHRLVRAPIRLLVFTPRVQPSNPISFLVRLVSSILQ